MNETKKIYTVNVTNISLEDATLYERLMRRLTIKTEVVACGDGEFIYKTDNYVDYYSVIEFVSSILKIRALKGKGYSSYTTVI